MAPRRRSSGRIAGPFAVVLGLVGIFAAGVGLGQFSDFLPSLSSFFSAGSASDGPFPVLPASRPVKVTIGTIGVKAPVQPVGLAEDGSIAAPDLTKRNETGWYEEGPSPGQYGPAIIVGHVDGNQGPAVFQKLGSLRRGDLIEVTRRDRKVAVFRVDTVESHQKVQLPAKRVYGDFSRPGLRLITCGGRWIGGDTGYAENVVVYASMVRTRRS